MNYKKNIFLVLIICTQTIICSENIMMLNSANSFNAFIDKSDTLSVVKFYATWCEFSQKNEPLYQEPSLLVSLRILMPADAVTSASAIS